MTDIAEETSLCEWRESSPYLWNTGCGMQAYLVQAEAIRFCAFCGQPLRLHPAPKAEAESMQPSALNIGENT